MSRTDPRIPRSIAATIVLLVTCSSFLILGLFAIFLYRVFDTFQRQEHARFLASKLHYLRSEIQSSAQPGESEREELDEIQQVIDRENASRRFGKLFVEVLDEHGSPLMRTDGAGRLMEGKPLFPSAGSSVNRMRPVYWEAPDGRHYVLTSLSVAAGPLIRNVRVALDWTSEEHSIEQFRRMAVGGLVLGTLIAAFGAALIARKALRPLSEITRTTRQLEVRTLDSRIDSGMWPLELSELAVAFGGMQERLSESFARLSRFSADLAHELRTPINNMMGEAEVALRGTRSVEEHRHVLESLLEELGRLSRMIESLLFLARAERGSDSLQSTVIDANAEASKVIEYHRAVADDKGVSLSLTGTAELSTDRDLFQRALSNLLSNALQYTPSGGRVGVVIAERGNHVAVEVRDSGVGIDAINLHRVFDRFFRADEARSHYPDGSGLGLSIVRSIMELHGGSASVASEAGRGTVVTLLYPSDARMTKM